MLTSMVLTEGQRLPDAALQQVIGVAFGYAAITAVVIWVQMTVTVRRAHDRDGSSKAFWVYALVSVTFVASGFLMSALDLRPPFAPAWALGLMLAAIAWMVIQFGLQPGDPKTNRWGPAPKPFFSFNSPNQNDYRPPQI